MTVKSSQKKHSVGILKIAFWAGIMFLLITVSAFIGDRFYAIATAFDARSLLMLIGVLMMVIGVLIAVLSAKKVSKDSFNLSSFGYTTLVFVPIWLGALLLIKSI